MQKTFSLLFILKILILPLSFISLTVSARYFGTNIERDIWLIVLNLINAINAGVWGPINETFRAKFTIIKEEEGEKAALQNTQSLLTVILIFSVLLVFLVMLFPGFFSKMISASNFHGDGFNKILIISSFVMIISQFNSIIVSVLNAYNVFYIPEIINFITTIFNIVLTILLAPKIGIYSLIIVYYISNILLLSAMLFYAHKKKIALFKNWVFKWKYFYVFLLYALPMYMPYIIAQLVGVYENKLVTSLGEGYVSSIDYAKKIPFLLLGILSNIIMTLLLPNLTRYFVQNDKDNFNQSFREVLQIGLLLIGLLLIFISTSSSHLTNIFFNKGSITPTKLDLISHLMLVFLFPIIAIFVYQLFSQVLLATKQTKQYGYIGVLTQIGCVVFYFIFFPYLKIYTFPLGFSFCWLASGLYFSSFYPYKNNGIFKVFIKYGSFILLVFIISYFIKKMVDNYLTNDYIYIIILGCIELSLFIALATLFKFNEVNKLLDYIKLKLNRNV